MAIRTTLYGYQVKNGKTVVHDEESEVVKEVFSLYVEGNTLNRIASMLTEKKIVYFQDEVKWNKNTINRMLENEKYMGNEIYPMIISTSLFDKVKSIKEKKSCKQEKHSPKVELLRKITICGECGSRYKRVNTWGSREKWMCSKGCNCLKYVDDDTLEKAVTDIFNSGVRNLELFNVIANSQYQPTIEVTKGENELIRLLEQPELDYKAIANGILNIAKIRFDCCEFDSGEITGELKEEISDISVVESIRYDEIKEYIKQVIIQSDGSITSVFINNSKITKKGVVENAS